MATKIDKILAGSQVTDELQNSLGASEYSLDHDTFFGGNDFDIYTAAASGGTHLVENTHYTLHDEDTDLTTEASKTVYTTVKITDPTYQACDLYFTYKTVGDYNEAVDVNILTDILSKSADYTIKDHDRNPTILITTGAADKTITWPTVADNTGKIITVMKVDSGAGKVINDGEGAETIDGFATIENLQQFDMIKAISDGTQWLRINPLSWHKFANPSTGWKASKTTWATADSFSAGLEVTFSEVPAGAKAVRCFVQSVGTRSSTFWRKSGDANISNTPNADSEWSHIMIQSDEQSNVMVFWLSSDYKVQFTVQNAATDLHVAYPVEYLI